MGLLNLKFITARKFIKKQRKVSDSKKEFEITPIRRVGVVAELSLIQTYDFTKRLSQQLNIQPEEVKMCLFDPSGKEEAPEFNRLCNEKDFGLNAKIKSEFLNKFVNNKFDLLINYCDPELIYPKVIMLRSVANLKAGFDHESNFFNDISVKTSGNDIDTFNMELLKYLKILKLIN